MRKTPTGDLKGKKRQSKIKLGIPDLEHSKSAVLRSLGSMDSRRGYQHAIDEFVAWYCSEFCGQTELILLRSRCNSKFQFRSGHETPGHEPLASALPRWRRVASIESQQCELPGMSQTRCGISTLKCAWIPSGRS